MKLVRYLVQVAEYVPPDSPCIPKMPFTSTRQVSTAS